MGQIYWDQVAVGDLIPALVKPALNRVQIAKFAAATLDYNPLHLDDEFAKTEGYGGVFAHGLLSLVLIEEALTCWAKNMRIVSLSGTFHKLVWPGDSLTAKGLINEHLNEHHDHRIKLDVWVENQNQEIVVKGTATCVLWKDKKEETKHHASLPPLSAQSRHELEHSIKERLEQLRSVEQINALAKQSNHGENPIEPQKKAKQKKS